MMAARKKKAAPRERAKKRNPPKGKGGAQTFKRLHWGQEGKGAIVLDAPDPNDGPVTVLGELRAVEYDTKKGRDEELVTYVHGFSRKKPFLCVNAKGRLLICGGSYVVETRGIVG